MAAVTSSEPLELCPQNQWNFIEHNNVNLTHLNRGGLHLSNSGTSLLAENFCKYIDQAIAVWKYDHIPDPPISTNRRSTQNANVFGPFLVVAWLWLV